MNDSTSTTVDRYEDLPAGELPTIRYDKGGYVERSFDVAGARVSAVKLEPVAPEHAQQAKSLQITPVEGSGWVELGHGTILVFFTHPPLGQEHAWRLCFFDGTKPTGTKITVKIRKTRIGDRDLESKDS
ncbi:hypothetical protein [Nannocystis punicea]|uniref:Uncharacterized protein n=1 Tax=Nannocystis punicea TaxID=2995304 RepID=A0ABY7H878_9BACT|nr:hypothetical protein [Nannocystis poenicansa]WAS95472.1 hypothetical protein O0S08_04865 [Nannocystis poenicansa]